MTNFCIPSHCVNGQYNLGYTEPVLVQFWVEFILYFLNILILKCNMAKVKWLYIKYQPNGVIFLQKPPSIKENTAGPQNQTESADTLTTSITAPNHALVYKADN